MVYGFNASSVQIFPCASGHDVIERDAEIPNAPWPQLLCFRLRPPGGVNKPAKKLSVEKKEEKKTQGRKNRAGQAQPESFHTPEKISC